MGYITICFVMLAFMIFGCSPKEVRLTPTEQQQLKEIQKDESLLLGKETEKRGREGIIIEEELVRDSGKDREGRDLTKDRLFEVLPEGELKALFQDIRFEFDSYSIKEEYFKRLDEIGAWLDRNRGVHIVIEGHCDERGTVEYNLVLGQKRADSVKNYLSKVGVEQGRIRTISYGKEMPLDPGHNEEAWAKNRRASFKIEKKG
ncbi:MAG: peptidoglycan-associated lipoprotein Pal [Syntrophorhabdaceae bacterium]|nr:peptidoglycan-associated lipoprotein Pal [Syntrophorhabdaceae bacterium]